MPGSATGGLGVSASSSSGMPGPGATTAMPGGSSSSAMSAESYRSQIRAKPDLKDLKFQPSFAKEYSYSGTGASLAFARGYGSAGTGILGGVSPLKNDGALDHVHPGAASMTAFEGEHAAASSGPRKKRKSKARLQGEELIARAAGNAAGGATTKGLRYQYNSIGELEEVHDYLADASSRKRQRRLFQEENRGGRTWEMECARVPSLITEMWKVILLESNLGGAAGGSF